MRSIWWARPLYVLSTLPLLRELCDAAYRRVADNRYRIAGVCRLPPQRSPR
jgi:predicted DCC family thiol-disulfide oxidoreductase YuxK